MKNKRIIKTILIHLLMIIMFSMTVLARGWEQDANGDWHYRKEDGSLVTNGRMKSGTDTFYLNEYGNIEKDFFLQENTFAYYFSHDGRMVRNVKVLIRKNTKSNKPIEKDMTLSFDNMGRCKKVNGSWEETGNDVDTSLSKLGPDSPIQNETVSNDENESKNEFTEAQYKKRADKIYELNSAIYKLSTTAINEAFYYSDIRDIVKKGRLSSDNFMDLFTDSTFTKNIFDDYVLDPKLQITYNDLIIPEYSGYGQRLDEEEKNFAKNFDIIYQYKTYGDLIHDMITKHRDLFSSGWDRLISLDETTNHYRFFNRLSMSKEDLALANQYMYDVDEFNPLKLRYTENGFFTTYKK